MEKTEEYFDEWKFIQAKLFNEYTLKKRNNYYSHIGIYQ